MPATAPMSVRSPARCAVRPRRALALAALVGVLLSGSAAKPPRPLIITQGGTYSGTFESRDANVPAVSIRTGEPVILQRSIVRGRGHLIVSEGVRADVTIRDVRGEAITPVPEGKCAGRFASIENFRSVRIENCYLQNTSGIYLLDYEGDGSKANSVTILRNVARNIDGRNSDGRGGFAGGPHLVQFVQLDKVRRVAGMQIGWNEVVNEPGRSRVEDVISVYLSSGTPRSPLSIHNNFIRGAYPMDPTWPDYAGGGIMLGDGVSDRGSEHDPCFVVAYDNQVIDTVNYGIAISAGHDLHFYRNRILSAGHLADGERLRAQNVGAYVWDSYKSGPKRFYRNRASDNTVGWANPKGGRNDWWHPHSAAWDRNAHWRGNLRRDLYDAEARLWHEKRESAKVIIGPRHTP